MLKNKKRVGIIGAGPSGLAQLIAFKSEHKKSIKIPEIICFEKQDNWGGLWKYNSQTGIDKYGEIIHGSMYKNLWSNGPKECLEFANYYFIDHFGYSIPSFPPREVILDYIEGRAIKADIRDQIRFNTSVKNLKFIKSKNTFIMTAHDITNDHIYKEEFDYIIVAAGHFSYPNFPYLRGSNQFDGTILHSHDFRDASKFKGQDILLIGSSYSAEDIGAQCHKYGAKSITNTFRKSPMGYNWPKNWEEKPEVVRLKGNKAYFSDKSSKHIDSIIICTGYCHRFPFLSDSLKLKTENVLYPLDLYMGIVWEKNPNLMYLGMQNQWYTFNMFDAQAWYAKDVILGKIKLPEFQKMQLHTKKWHKQSKLKNNDKFKIEFQGKYTEMLTNKTDYPNFDIKGINNIFFDWLQHKKDDIMGYRDKSHSSLMTGTRASMHHSKWVEEMDSSLETFLKQK
tara:strand:- start:3296 stop:4648 length:1353 start_codon:yes stop_codon:yes gene_type:complete